MVTNGSVLFFFFQAEDGIRDRNVTGVQTCALPISLFPVYTGKRGYPTTFLFVRPGPGYWEIGRASCRERVRSMGVDRSRKTKREQKVNDSKGEGRQITTGIEDRRARGLIEG